MKEQSPSETIAHDTQQRSAKGTKRNDEFLRASINHAGFKLDISSRNATKALAEIRRIMECMKSEEIDSVDDFMTFEMSTLLSEEFVNNCGAMSEIRRLLGMEQQYRVVKEVLPAVEEIDLLHGKKNLRLESHTIKRGVSAIVASVNTQTTKNILIHVKGLVSEHERLVIVDHVHERVPHARIRAYQTDQDIEGKVLVEALFFGDYDDEVA